MSAEGGHVCECPVAEATHVGFLSCVNTPVPLQGVDLGESLVAVFTAVWTLT